MEKQNKYSKIENRKQQQKHKQHRYTEIENR